MVEGIEAAAGPQPAWYDLHFEVMMKTIETVATVNDDGPARRPGPSVPGAGDAPCGRVIDEKRLPGRPQRTGLGDMAAFRESLGASTHPGNTVVEMREEERF